MIFSISFLILGCNANQDPLPRVYVDITLNLNDPMFYEINTPGNYVENIVGGLAGIIVYYTLEGNYVAFDQACTYDFNTNGARVHVTDAGAGIVKDSICGSEFSLTNDGAVLKGPATYPLRKYYTTYYPNSNTLRITSFAP